jgi:hypothetical protein
MQPGAGLHPVEGRANKKKLLAKIPKPKFVGSVALHTYELRGLFPSSFAKGGILSPSTIIRKTMNRILSVVCGFRAGRCCFGMVKHLIPALAWMAVLAAGHAATAIDFTFTLSAEHTTTAGAFDSSGKLVKTIWRNETFVPGTYTKTWDGTDDNGASAPAGSYQIRLLCHNMVYSWDGVIGNTYQSFYGDTPKTLGTPGSLVIDGTNALFTVGWTESNKPIRRFTTGNPNNSYGVTPANFAAEFRYLATDGARYYVANIGNGWDANKTTFVMAYNLSDNSQYLFPSGVTATLSPPNNKVFSGVIDVDQTDMPNNRATGMAVQKSGNVLAVAHGPLNTVRLFDKVSGSALGAISVTGPRGIAFAPNGDLWVITGTSLQQFTGVGTTNFPATTVSGLSNPVGVAVHPSDNDIVLVADSGTRQQVKAFTSAGVALWTYGQAGGYEANGPTVAADKFQFASPFIPLAVEPDGSFWVRDSGTQRFLHFSAARDYIDQIAYVNSNYTCSVDPNDPTRVTSGWLEYQIDYNKQMLPGDPQAAGGNKSWKLVKNWTPLSTTGTTYAGTHTGLTTVVTLSNGRTYGVCINKTAAKTEVVELTASGLRFTGILLSKDRAIYANGDIRYKTKASNIQTIYRQTLTGFDGSGNPQWGAATVLASAPCGSLYPTSNGINGYEVFPITSSNVVVSFDNSGASDRTGMHLGGVAVSGTNWNWMAAPAVTTNIPLDGLGSFDIGDNITHAGGKVSASERNVLYGFHGENWSGIQANQFMHYWDDGLFIGQFGAHLPGPGNFNPGNAGNSFCLSLVKHGRKTYLYHQDENEHGGIHRWTLMGADSVREYASTLSIGGTVTLSEPVVSFPTNVRATPDSGTVTLTWSAVPGASSYTIKAARSVTSDPLWAVKASGVGSSPYTVTGLTNGQPYYFTVSAIVAGVESAPSSPILVTPFDSTVPVHADGRAVWDVTQKIIVSSTNVAHNMHPTRMHTQYGLLGLRRLHIGRSGFALFNYDGVGTNKVVLSPTVSNISLSAGWTPKTFLRAQYVLDGANTVTAGLRANGSATVSIFVTDNDWHTLTVVSPPQIYNPRNDSITLTPFALSSPAATFTTYDPAYGYVHQMQFRFKGNVTLTVQQLSIPKMDSANLSAIFID